MVQTVVATVCFVIVYVQVTQMLVKHHFILQVVEAQLYVNTAGPALSLKEHNILFITMNLKVI